MCNRSHSILLFRYSQISAQWEIVLVQRKYSYEFYDFFKYIRNSHKVQNILGNMTIRERMFLLTKTWAEFCHEIREKYQPENEDYFNKVRKEDWFLQACCVEDKALLWEIPKGKARGRENGFASAIREFEEETSIPYISKKNPSNLGCSNLECSSFEISPNYRFTGIKIDYCMYDDNKRYPITYYVAITNEQIDIKKEYIDKLEIADAKWVNICDINNYHGNYNIKNVLGLSIKKMRMLGMM